MNAQRYRHHLKVLGLTQNGAARFLDISERQSRRYASPAEHKAGLMIERRIEMLLELMVAQEVTPAEAFALTAQGKPRALSKSPSTRRPPRLRSQSTNRARSRSGAALGPA